jgi:hypothetical protein
MQRTVRVHRHRRLSATESHNREQPAPNSLIRAPEVAFGVRTVAPDSALSVHDPNPSVWRSPGPSD